MKSTTGAMRPAFRMFLCAAAVCACLSQGSAATIAIINPSFEDPAQSSGGFNSSAPTGWSTTGVFFGVWNPAPNTYITSPTPDQNQIVYLGFDGTPTSLSQTLTDSLLANTTYTLTFYAGLQNDHPNGNYTVSLLAGSTVLASDTDGPLSAGNYSFRSIVYQTGANPTSGTLGIQVDVPYNQVLFDAFTLDATASSSSAPEPGTLGVTGASAALLAYLRARTIRARKRSTATEQVV